MKVVRNVRQVLIVCGKADAYDSSNGEPSKYQFVDPDEIGGLEGHSGGVSHHSLANDGETH